LETHVRVLGLLNIVVGTLSGLTAIFDILFFGGGVTLSAYLDVNSIVTYVWLGAALLLMVPCIVTGIALLGFRSWARTFGIVLSILEMLIVPLGTIVGIYGLVVLFSEDVDMIFERRYGEYVAGRR
jgi:hypothetical protein